MFYLELSEAVKVSKTTLNVFARRGVNSSTKGVGLFGFRMTLFTTKMLKR